MWIATDAPMPVAPGVESAGAFAGVALAVLSRAPAAAKERSDPVAPTLVPESTPDVVFMVTTPTASEPAKVTFAELPAPETEAALKEPLRGVRASIVAAPPDRSASPRRAEGVIVARFTAMATPTPDPPAPPTLPSASALVWACEAAWIFLPPMVVIGGRPPPLPAM